MRLRTLKSHWLLLGLKHFGKFYPTSIFIRKIWDLEKVGDKTNSAGKQNLTVTGWKQCQGGFTSTCMCGYKAVATWIQCGLRSFRTKCWYKKIFWKFNVSSPLASQTKCIPLFRKAHHLLSANGGLWITAWFRSHHTSTYAKLEAPLLSFQSQVCPGEQGDLTYVSEQGLCKPRLVHVALTQDWVNPMRRKVNPFSKFSWTKPAQAYTFLEWPLSMMWHMLELDRLGRHPVVVGGNCKDFEWNFTYTVVFKAHHRPVNTI